MTGGLGVLFGQADAGNLRHRIDDRGDHLVVHDADLAGEDLGDRDPLVLRLVGEHRPRRDVADGKTDRVLGVHIIASVAGTMIAQAAQAMEFGATSEDIAYTCHAHPTHAEALKEAAMAVTGKPIHI